MVGKSELVEVLIICHFKFFLYWIQVIPITRALSPIPFDLGKEVRDVTKHLVFMTETGRRSWPWSKTPSFQSGHEVFMKGRVPVVELCAEVNAHQNIDQQALSKVRMRVDKEGWQWK